MDYGRDFKACGCMDMGTGDAGVYAGNRGVSPDPAAFFAHPEFALCVGMCDGMEKGRKLQKKAAWTRAGKIGRAHV